MLRTAILIDWRPQYLGQNGHASSVLLAPFGARRVLHAIRAELAAVEPDMLVLAPNFEASGVYAAAVRSLAPDALLLPQGELPAYLETLEPADRALLVDARFVSSGGLELRRLFRAAAQSTGVTHLVRPRRGGAGAAERVLRDGRQRVCSIQRVYDGVTRVESVGVSAMLCSAAVARRHAWHSPVCLREVRAALAAGGVPSQDVSASRSAFDLLEERGLLRLNERAAETLHVRPPVGFTQLRPGVWAAPGCSLAPSSRLFGPVLLHECVTIGDGAAVIGPAVIGANARLERQATVAYAVLDAESVVPAGADLTCRVLPAGEAAPLADLQPSAPAWSEHNGLLPARLGGEAEPLRPAGSRLFRLLKRGVDVSLSAAGLLVLSPLLLATAAAVKLTSRGPVLFGHEREGRGGRLFRCWKFRTMVARAHAAQRGLYKGSAVDGPQFKMDNDPRVTRLGRFLRVSNIDELPQLYNVLRGHMSLIGPRPSPFRENQICVRWRVARLSVRPGITGLWQVCRSDRSTGDFHQWIYYDTLYVKHQSIALDLRILLATFLTLGGRWSVPVGWMIPRHGRGSVRRGGVRRGLRRALEGLRLTAAANGNGLAHPPLPRAAPAEPRVGAAETAAGA